MSVRYVLLMRHASHEADPFDPRTRHLSNGGREEVRQVGERLREYLESADRYRCMTKAPEIRPLNPSDPPPVVRAVKEHLRQDAHKAESLKLGAIFSSRSPEAEKTARALGEVLGLKSEPTGNDWFWPEQNLAADPYVYHWSSTATCLTKTGIVTPVAEILKTKLANDANAVLVVGHAPQLGWLGRHLTGKGIPIRRAELVCIERGAGWPRPKWQLAWALTPVVDSTKAREQEQELREKIKGKMESAKLLGAIFLGLPTFVIQAPNDLATVMKGASGSLEVNWNLWITNWDLFLSFGVGVGFFLIGTILFFSAYFAYDSLLMPRDFWTDDRRPSRTRRWLVKRPPSGSTWVIYQNMLMIWNYRFTPAVISSILAPGFLGYSTFAGHLFPGRNATMFFALFLSLLALVILLVLQYMIWTRPVMGAED